MTRVQPRDESWHEGNDTARLLSHPASATSGAPLSARPLQPSDLAPHRQKDHRQRQINVVRTRKGGSENAEKRQPSASQNLGVDELL